MFLNFLHGSNNLIGGVFTETKYQLHAKEMVRSIDLSKYDGIVCVSGDGVLVEVKVGMLFCCGSVIFTNNLQYGSCNDACLSLYMIRTRGV